ncbi:MAG: hypothetical protein HY347_10450 [candidate division NC10 bacterium]|nr:hypothetical protein [candidate division NC10 bacterium]
MSDEAGILLLGIGQLLGLLVSIGGFWLMSRNFREVSRIQRAIAGLIVQESEKLQALLREASG